MLWFSVPLHMVPGDAGSCHVDICLTPCLGMPQPQNCVRSLETYPGQVLGQQVKQSWVS